MVEKTFIMVKPDGIQRALIGEIIKRFENKGLKLVAVKLFQMNEKKAKKHYQEHLKKEFFDELLDFITSGPVIAMVWEADNAVYIGRKLVGSTRPNEAIPGTIRGDYCINTQFNLIHASDSVKSAKKEIALFFEDDEIIRYEKSIKHWLGLDL
ncbi:MAG TPA: nucleoside-diphosphate kinase [Candidatus Mcinerneyibacterium sp.]|nr:nucleoside-diphosphate kinase [Candidatus Mcinerneyibacterium sp.]